MKQLLTFKKDQKFDHYYATSEKNGLVVYFVTEGAWFHLSVMNLGEYGPKLEFKGAFHSLEEAQNHAQELEDAGLQNEECVI